MLEIFDNFARSYTNPRAPLDVRRGVFLLWLLLIASTLADGLDMLFSDVYANNFWAGLLGAGFSAAFPLGINRRSNGMRYAYGLSAMLSVAWALSGHTGGFFPSGFASSVFSYISAPLTFLTVYLLFNGKSGIWFTKKNEYFEDDEDIS